MNSLVRWTKVSALLASSYATLVTAVLFGLIVPGADVIPGLASPAELGLGSNRVGIEPLTDRYIDRALGPGATSSGGQRLDRIGLRGRGPGGRAVDAVPGEVVDHAFTNNDQANAYQVPRLPFTGRTSTAEADRETGEPECGTQLGGTVWYRYTATRSEALLADTFGTNYQTSLAAYRQTHSGPVALDNACDFDPQGNSQIKVDVNSGTTYLFQIGAAVRGGALTFHLKRFGSMILASVATGGEPGNAPSIESSISFDGRFVAFASQATNFISALRGGAFTSTCVACYNVFLRDRQTGTTNLVSVGLEGGGGNKDSRRPQVSDDGRYVSFDSRASNLVPADTNNVWDVFVRDMRAGRTERVSLDERGEQLRPGPTVSLVSSGPSWTDAFNWAGARSSSMSADGRFVAFMSRSPNLVEEDNDEFWDVFVRDRIRGTTRVVSLDGRGKGLQGVYLASLSRNGRWIVLLGDAPMTEDDGDLSRDVFVRDLWTGATELVSVPEKGQEFEGHRDAVIGLHISQRSISDDGRHVVFGSEGALVDGDTNGALDVFVRDRLSQTTERVSVSSSGRQGTGTSASGLLGVISGDWSISGDGQTVAFTTELNGLEPSDENSASDVYVHDRANGETLRVSINGDLSGGFDSQISGDGLYTTFYGTNQLSQNDTNTFDDVFVFSPLLISELAGPTQRSAHGSVPTAPCSVSSEYTRVGLAGAHEDVTPVLIPGKEDVADRDAYSYPERSVVRFKYRLDISRSSVSPFAQMADVRIALSWDNDSDYDLFIYDDKDELLAYSYRNNFETGRGELALVSQIPHCSDLRVDIVNTLGLPTREMTLDTTLGRLE